ncbi:uncharacterized protein GLRG_10681 [Colletotrichum graminicola M1.001]|uniref:Uncharacterized protein n=1 Tax=Colletotrichum graminicola (strain M1.001 / M2 / FGSC 10212) TaxID=645133 RepID=E3QXE9_COLGM|nr:uncharacterized protein GLRG_10681 [Colletotrichum graminicola M1.001]EFQ35537.1 hypothetical protein GLRG_10681 [Colletotrichum graminicola M1.001]
MALIKELATAIFKRNHTSRSPAYSKLDDAEALKSQSPRPRTRFSRRFRIISPKTMLVIVAPLLLFPGLLFVSNQTDIISHIGHGKAHLPTVEKGGSRRFRIVVPADSPSPDLCKMLMSAIVSGHPSPVIVNWGRDFNKSPGWFGGSHLGKIDGALDFLDSITSDDSPEDERLGPDDLVIIVDAYDIWFQLPPSILIRRYLAQNNAANERIYKEWDVSRSQVSSEMGEVGRTPKQSIIISAQKKCWPGADLGFDTHCDALPEYSAKVDLYGPNTDKDPKQMHDLRPRYLNSGSIVGPVSEMQQIWRASNRGNQAEWIKNQTEHPEDATREASQFDFGVGLDYVQNLFTPTVFEEDDGLYVVLGNTSVLQDASAERGVEPPRVYGIPEDMNGMRSPVEESGIDPRMGWNELPLYTDLWSTFVPVMVHHNAHRNGLKQERLRDWWKNNWFFPYLRQLMDLQLQPRKSGEPLFRIPERNGIEDLVFRAPEADTTKRNPRIFKKEDLKDEGLPEALWENLCKSEGHEERWKEIFDDGSGPIVEQVV